MNLDQHINKISSSKAAQNFNTEQILDIEWADFSFKLFCISICHISHSPPLSFFPLSFFSKADRPPSLSLFPTGDAMVRGGHGGARTMSTDVWHASDLGRAVYAPGFQVRQIGYFVVPQLGKKSS